MAQASLGFCDKARTTELFFSCASESISNNNNLLSPVITLWLDKHFVTGRRRVGSIYLWMLKLNIVHDQTSIDRIGRTSLNMSFPIYCPFHCLYKTALLPIPLRLMLRRLSSVQRVCWCNCLSSSISLLPIGERKSDMYSIRGNYISQLPLTARFLYYWRWNRLLFGVTWQ